MGCTFSADTPARTAATRSAKRRERPLHDTRSRTTASRNGGETNSRYTDACTNYGDIKTMATADFGSDLQDSGQAVRRRAVDLDVEQPSPFHLQPIQAPAPTSVLLAPPSQSAWQQRLRSVEGGDNPLRPLVFPLADALMPAIQPAAVASETIESQLILPAAVVSNSAVALLQRSTVGASPPDLTASALRLVQSGSGPAVGEWLHAVATGDPLPDVTFSSAATTAQFDDGVSGSIW